MTESDPSASALATHKAMTHLAVVVLPSTSLDFLAITEAKDDRSGLSLVTPYD